MKFERKTKTMEKRDTKNLTEVVDFTLDLTQLGIDVAADKKVDLSDLGLLVGRTPQLVSSGILAFSDLDAIPPELLDMDSEEAVALVSHVMVKLSVSDVKARAIVERSLKAAYANYDLVRAIVS